MYCNAVLTDTLCNVNVIQVMRDENGNSRGFGFVSFEEHEAAVKVILWCSLYAICMSVDLYELA